MSEAVLKTQQQVYSNCGDSVTNLASLRDERVVDQVIDALETCHAVLKDHCGPYSAYSAIHDLTNLDHYSEFTRDGITIISNLRFNDPIKEIVRNIIASAGRMVDFRAKDNTTTAMLLVTTVLLEHFKKIKDGAEVGRHKVTPHRLRYLYDKVISDAFRDLYDNYYIHKDDADVGAVVFMQAMSSSGGNVKLATCLRDIYMRTPKSCYEYTRYAGSMTEDDDDFVIEEYEYDLALEVLPSVDMSTISTDALGVGYASDSADVLVCYDGLYGARIVDNWKILDPNRPLVIITNSSDQPALITKIAEENKTRPAPISLWVCNSKFRTNGQTYGLEISVATAIAKSGSHCCDMGGLLVEDVKVEYSAGKMKLYNFIDKRDDGAAEQVHYSAYIAKTIPEPENVDPVVKQTYIALYTELTKAIEVQKSGHQDQHPEMYGYMLESLFSLVGYHVPTLRLGGMAHIQLANRSVVNDAIGAIMSSLSSGHIVGGIVAIAESLQFANDHNDPDYSELVTKGNIDLFKVVLSVINIIYGTDYTVDSVTHKQLSDTMNTNLLYSGENKLSYEQYVEKLNSDFNNFIYSPEVMDYPVVQPLRGLAEMFKRIRELVLNVVSSSEFLVQNTYLVYPEDK